MTLHIASEVIKAAARVSTKRPRISLRRKDIKMAAVRRGLGAWWWEQLECEDAAMLQHSRPPPSTEGTAVEGVGIVATFQRHSEDGVRPKELAFRLID